MLKIYMETARLDIDGSEQGTIMISPIYDMPIIIKSKNYMIIHF